MISQDPPAATAVVAGSAVNLVVSVNVPPVVTNPGEPDGGGGQPAHREHPGDGPEHWSTADLLARLRRRQV